MSHTDKTRPYWVQEKDPYNRRFQKIGPKRWIVDGSGSWERTPWFWKPMSPKTGCWCCSQKKAFFFEDGRKRIQWRNERQSLIKNWRFEIWYWEDVDNPE